jgi:transcriptional regulator with XRE-family HTH domain
MQNSSRTHKHSTPAEREKILQSYGQSQLTQKEFADQAGIGVSTLAAWRRKARESKGRRPSFVAVPNLLPSVPAGPAYRLQWPNGVSLEIRAGFLSEELADLLQVLQVV